MGFCYEYPLLLGYGGSGRGKAQQERRLVDAVARGFQPSRLLWQTCEERLEDGQHLRRQRGETLRQLLDRDRQLVQTIRERRLPGLGSIARGAAASQRTPRAGTTIGTTLTATCRKCWGYRT